MPRRKPELHAVPVVAEPPRRWYIAALETDELLAHAVKLFPESDYLPVAWIAAVAFLRTESKRGWVLDGAKP